MLRLTELVHAWTRIVELVNLDLTQEHRPLDAFSLRQLRGFFVGEPELRPAHPPSLQVEVAPLPVLDGDDPFPVPFHAPRSASGISDLSDARGANATYLARG